VNPALGDELKRSVAKAATYYATLGHASFAPLGPACLPV
jgi:hypothetical protein